MKDPELLYREGITHVLGGYQLIEEYLKIYLSRNAHHIRLLTQGRSTFNYYRGDFENHALGRLIDLFSKMNENSQLISSLRAVVKDRNSIAHKSLTSLYLNSQDSIDYASLLKELIKLKNEVDPVLKEVTQQVKELETKIASFSARA